MLQEWLKTAVLGDPNVVSGLMGGVSVIFIAKNIGFRPFVMTIVVGTICASYLTPIIAEFFPMSEAARSGVAFGIGVVGVNIVEGVNRLAKRFSDNPLHVISTIQGRKGE